MKIVPTIRCSSLWQRRPIKKTERISEKTRSNRTVKTRKTRHSKQKNLKRTMTNRRGELVGRENYGRAFQSGRQYQRQKLNGRVLPIRRARRVRIRARYAIFAEHGDKNRATATPSAGPRVFTR